MSLLTLSDVRKAYGADVILEAVTLSVHEGDRIGVVGRNGAGKTTLFRMLVGDEEPDGGLISRARDVTTGYLPQVPELVPERPVLEEVMSSLDAVRSLERRLREIEHEMSSTTDGDGLARLAEEHGHVHERFEHLGGYRMESQVHTVLAGLGVAPELFARPCGVLSGGEKSRVALAKLLIQAPDLMLLDEPTNHLDLAGVEWLEEFLQGSGHAFLVISHDRLFLDRVTRSTLEVDNGSAKLYPQPYGGFEQLKADEIKTLVREVQKQQDFIEKERNFIRRHLGSQRSREAQGRLKRLERVELLAPPPSAQDAMKLDMTPARSLGNAPMTVEGLSARAGERTLFLDLSFDLLPGDRLGIVGRNGGGKSTLLKILAGRMTAAAGRVRLGYNVDLGFFDQEHAILNPNATVYSTIHDYRPKWTDFMVRSWLARFLLFSEDAARQVSTLSGGERGRLAIARLLLDQPNMLFLDEPTNHLDISSRQALEETLQSYPGTLVVVSHDRWFLDRVVSKILWLDDAGSRLFHSSYSEAAARRRADRDAAARKAQEARDTKSRQPPKPVAKPTGRKKRPLSAIEADIMRVEEKRAALLKDLEDASIYTDGRRVREVQDEIERLNAELTALEAEWSEYA